MYAVRFASFQYTIQPMLFPTHPPFSLLSSPQRVSALSFLFSSPFIFPPMLTSAGVEKAAALAMQATVAATLSMAVSRSNPLRVTKIPYPNTVLTLPPSTPPHHLQAPPPYSFLVMTYHPLSTLVADGKLTGWVEYVAKTVAAVTVRCRTARGPPWQVPGVRRPGGRVTVQALSRPAAAGENRTWGGTARPGAPPPGRSAGPTVSDLAFRRNPLYQIKFSMTQPPWQ
eukprot:754824-Hanusia_phi.AAC.1